MYLDIICSNDNIRELSDLIHKTISMTTTWPKWLVSSTCVYISERQTRMSRVFVYIQKTDVEQEIHVCVLSNILKKFIAQMN